MNLCVLVSLLGPPMLSTLSTKSCSCFKVLIWYSSIWGCPELVLLSVPSLHHGFPFSILSMFEWQLVWTVQTHLTPGNGLVGCWLHGWRAGQWGNFGSLPRLWGRGWRELFSLTSQWHKDVVPSERRSREWWGVCPWPSAAACPPLQAWPTKHGSLVSAPVFPPNSQLVGP